MFDPAKTVVTGGVGKWSASSKTKWKSRARKKRKLRSKTFKISVTTTGLRRKAEAYFGFRPERGVPEMVQNMYRHLDVYGDLSDDNSYNIRVLKKMRLGSR